MKAYKIASFILAAAMAVTMTVGCSKNENKTNTQPTEVIEPGKLEGIADKEVEVAVKEEANENETVFKLNSVVDSGATDGNGGKYLYLDVSITNPTDKEYDLSVLNNFYILMSDQKEIHFDVRTQLHATKNIDSYIASPFTIPANGEFSGLIGGFVVDENATDFTVCFFPTLDDARNKSSVVKVNVSAADIKPLG